MEKHHELETWLGWIDELAQKNYVVIDNFITKDLYSQLRSFFLQNIEKFDQAGIGTGDLNLIKTNIRGDQTYWLDRNRDTQLKETWSLIQETLSILNRYCYLSLSDFEFHFAHYPEGGHYEKHLDQFANRNNRMISMIIYLNEGWQPGDGGELEIFRDEDDSLLVEPIGGRCALFKSAEVPHAVRTSFKSRYSLTGWLLYQPAVLGGIL